MKEEKERIYLSLPISGYDLEERRATASQKKLELEAKGCEVFNPLENGLPAEATTYQHLRRDFHELTREDKPYTAIYMMRRWTHSAGCKRELEIALSCGMGVYFEEHDGMVKFE